MDDLRSGARGRRDRPEEATGGKEQGGYASGGRTLTEVVSSLEDGSYRGQVVVESGGRLTCRSCGRTSPADQFEARTLAREEGASDPDDMTLVGTVNCPACGAGATLVLKYGPLASVEEAEVASALHPPA